VLSSVPLLRALVAAYRQYQSLGGLITGASSEIHQSTWEMIPTSTIMLFVGIKWSVRSKPDLESLICSTIHRITEWFGLAGTLKITQFQPPCHEQGPLPPAQGAQSSILPGLEPCQGGGSHSFSGQPGPGPHHPHGEGFLPNI